MSERFIKFIPSDEANFLLLNYPNSFIVLSFIASHARRINGHPDGLIIGDALICSENFSPGLSRQNFRTAIEKLVELKHIKIVSNGKRFLEREKSTIKITITGYLVNLTSSTIYDINGIHDNQLSNQRPTNDQPTTNHKQERIRKNKKEKEDTPHTPLSDSKIYFRERVTLTQIEFDKLQSLHGDELLNSMLDILDAYKGSSGRHYECDYYTMKKGGWVLERALENRNKPKEKILPLIDDRRTLLPDGKPVDSPWKGKI